MLVLLIVVAVLGCQGSSDSSVASLPPKNESNRIAFVGPDAHIHTADPDGSHARRISSGTGAFSWPAWSPDGRSLIFSGVSEDESGNSKTSLLAFDGASGNVTELYVGEPGVRGLLAEGVLHYPLVVARQ